MTANCTVRPVLEHDLPTVLAWRNDPKVRAAMLTQHEITVEEHQAWFAAACKNPRRRLLIVENAGSPIGFAHFGNCDIGSVSDWGFYAKPDSPPGTGQRMGRAALSYAFDVIKLHKVCGQALETNDASIYLHEKLGFTREGVLRDQYRINGIFRSLLCFGLLEREWREAKSNSWREQ